MVWQIEISETAKKQLSKLDRQTQGSITGYLRKRIGTDKNPRRFGKSLRKNLAGLWRYRVSDHRIICEIQDKKVMVLVLRLGHRREIY